MFVIRHVLVEYHCQIVQLLLFCCHQVFVVNYLLFQHVELLNLMYVNVDLPFIVISNVCVHRLSKSVENELFENLNVSKVEHVLNTSDCFKSNISLVSLMTLSKFWIFLSFSSDFLCSSSRICVLTMFKYLQRRRRVGRNKYLAFH